ncbi:MAG TPA: YaiO family outer membrane beta-barrel protein [Pyrinomonadaceae bacterium]|nr:YaiO family outer membrane beta-barrel protein [Pyrinomonadaceae bacterium]
MFGLLLFSCSVAGQTPPVQPGPQPAATPGAADKAGASDQPKPVDPELQLEIGASHERLSNGQDWQGYFFNFNRKFRSAQILYGSVCVARRFHQTDPCLMAGLYQPLNKSRSWSVTVEASGSPHHQILPVVSIYGQVEHNFGKGWLGHAGLRHSHYSADDVILGTVTNKVNMGILGVENYFRKFRAAYTLYVANLNGRGTATSHSFQGSYYYDERNSIGLGVAFGEEIESVGRGVLLRTPVQEISMNGRQWMNQRWGFSYVALWHRQGHLYTRSGGQIGLLLRF